MDIIFKGRHTDVLERFRKHATAKLTKIERLYAKAIRVDVEVTTERNPRQSGRKDRVELTITSSGPTIRAEAAAEDRFAALDLALAKLESRLRRASDRRKDRHGAHAAVRPAEVRPGSDSPPESELATADDGPAADDRPAAAGSAADRRAAGRGAAGRGAAGRGAAPDDVVPIDMVGDGPLVVREKFHAARPMAIDQALLEMELVGHDFFLFRDTQGGIPSVVYRRRGYQYGVIRLVEKSAEAANGVRAATDTRTGSNGRANGQPRKAARLRPASARRS